MDGMSFDIRGIMDAVILAGLAKDKDPQSKGALAVLKVFQKHNIGSIEAMEILMEIIAVTTGM